MATYTPAKKLVEKIGARPAAKRDAKPYINPYLAAILLGTVLFTAFFITGSGLGASGGMNRMLVFLQDQVAPDHVDRTPYLLSLAGGTRNPLDSWIVFLTIGVAFRRSWFWIAGGARQAGNQQRAAYFNPHPLDDGLSGRCVDGLRGASGARVHLRAGAFRRRGDVGGKLGVYAGGLRGWIRRCLLCSQAVAVRG